MPASSDSGMEIGKQLLDWKSADAQFQIADGGQIPPDAAFDREWALALLERVNVRLGEESAKEGMAGRFACMKPFLTMGKGEIPDASAAAALEINEGAVRVVMRRLRKRYRALLRQEIPSRPGCLLRHPR